MGGTVQRPHGSQGGPRKLAEYHCRTNYLNRVHASFLELSRSFSKGFPATAGTPLLQADFVAIVARLGEMLAQIETLRDWIDFKALEEHFRQNGLDGLFANLMSRASSLPVGDVPNAMRMSLLQAWLNWVFADDPCLGSFRGENHERLVSEFRELDKKHWEQGVHSVIREINRLRPASSVVIPGGELQVLFKEANKQRRHLPLRKLFATIPNLLTQLKPCLLMSPISVSQFLDPEKTKFDLVIFDEASQLRSEDAPIVVEKEIPRIDEKLVLPEWVETYRVCRPGATQTSGLQFHDPDALPILKRMLSQIVEAEGPVHKDVAAARLARAWELDRAGNHIQKALEDTFEELLEARQLVLLENRVSWPN